ncbi:MAG: protein kinase [Opitutaceae bacterium]|nr:protein kinase [Opitutaceae bacterium]
MKKLPAEAETLFSDALALPAAERGTFLAKACGSDVELLAQLVALVAAHGGPDSILEPPSPLVLTQDEDKPIIGRYKLLQKIGEGGCGVVWMAEQEEPMRRRVAIKVIKLGMDTKSVVARFEAERQALAMMDHPNIAKIHDAGATEAGRPYFVMELVRGTPITKFCDEHQLKPLARLELFVKVCQAVQHAHQKAIVHRDLKPSNILVTVNDGQPTPKIIDFGIAKATQGRLTDATFFTAFEQFIGTPAYMSPEQADMSSLDIDTRSDIYSLGVLLYELLTGRAPFDAKKLALAGVDQIRRHIREVEPLRPSARLQTLAEEERTTIARLRGSAVSQLSLILRGDLDWIVMRCLEKDRTRRYDTANGLAMDVQRYLRKEPVVARPPSTVYLLRKLISRHKVGFTAAAAVAAAVVLGSVLTTAQALRALRAERAQNELQESNRQAELKASAARRVADERDQRLDKIRWARETALPEVTRFLSAGDVRAAFKLAREIESVLPDDPAVTDLWPRISHRVSLQTTPAGAKIYLKPYRMPAAEWEFVGISPLNQVLLPRDGSRWRIEKPGYATLERATGFRPLTRDPTVTQVDYSFILDPIESVPPSMVRVDAKPEGSNASQPKLGTFFIDRYEVTNRQFKEFVDRGGYSNLQFWRQPFIKDGKELAAAEVMSSFCDASGKPGPATWKNGTYPKGDDDYPVSGVSWFEAAAYAESIGKRLPSIHHWTHAGTAQSAEMLARLSNFGQQGVAPVGLYQGMSVFGAFDMTGNVKEWCWNETGAGARYILGGSWAEEFKFLNYRDALSPFDRATTNGFRCASVPAGVEFDSRSDDPVIEVSRDHTHDEPVNDQTFEIFKRLYSFDRTELDISFEGPEEVKPAWRRERVSFRTAYGNERMSAQVFLPVNRPPPYQAVIYFPGSGALHNSEGGSYRHFILTSGRAFIYPRYQGTFERSDGRSLNEHFSRINEFRSLVIEWSKDVSRTIDYLETRTDIQHKKLAFLGFSLGGALGFIAPAVENRLNTSVLISGGFWPAEVAPEVAQVNYAPRIRLPTLMLNGRFDFIFQLRDQRQLFHLLGTPPEHKRHVMLDAGHVIGPEMVKKEILDWLDAYLGPTK